MRAGAKTNRFIDAVRIVFLPLVACGMFLLAWFMAGPSLEILKTGTTVDGQVGAVIIIRPDDCDVVYGILNEIDVVFADGGEISCTVTEDGGIFARKEPDRLEIVPEPGLAAFLLQVARDESEGISRALARERVQSDPAKRVVGLRKRERASGLFGLQTRPVLLTAADRDGQLLDPISREVVTTGVFGTLAPDGVRVWDGEGVAPGEASATDFILFREGYTGQLKPVAKFDHMGKTWYVPAAAGQLRRQMPAFAMGLPCRITFDPNDPARAIVRLHPEALAGSQEAIVYASTALAAFFSLWVYPVCFVLIGVVALFAWILLMSLSLFPHPESGYEPPGRSAKAD